MAIPNLSAIPRRAGGATAATLLFERLPDQLFRPLASANRQQYWALLCALHERRFGPDAPLPPSHGFPTREIIQDIENELLLQEVWDDEDSETPETPIGIRANGVFNRLLESGWFRIDRFGVGWNVSMRPAVSQFLSRLVSFAETGPVFVAGKVRSIDLNLQLAESGEGAGDSLAEAAEQARNLLEHVRNTGTNIRDLMDSMGVEITTGQYVQRFFNDYIERVFIGDYRELRTREHPLSKRPQILRRVDEIHSSEAHRTRLIAWYESKRCPGDHGKAERLFERDIQRLLELQRIDDYLDRLDDEIRRANKRALAFLDYRLRSLRPIDRLVEGAINAVLSDVDNTIGAPFAPGEMISGDRLAEPRQRIERSPPGAARLGTFLEAYREQGSQEMLSDWRKAHGWISEILQRLRNTELLDFKEQMDAAYRTSQETFRNDVAIALSNNLDWLDQTMARLNKTLAECPVFTNGERYQFRRVARETFNPLLKFIKDIAARGAVDDLFEGAGPLPEQFKQLLEEKTMPGAGGVKSPLDDYREFFEFDIEIQRVDPMTKATKIVGHLSKRIGPGSGGEHRAPLYVIAGAALASAYRLDKDNRDGLGLILLDEAFNKMDVTNIVATMRYLEDLGLQVFMASPGENLGTLTAFLHRYFDIMRDAEHNVVIVEGHDVAEETRAMFREDLPEFNPVLIEQEIAQAIVERLANSSLIPVEVIS